MNEKAKLMVERPLVRKFGLGGLIEMCNGIAERKWTFCCRRENQEWEHLRWHGKPSDFEKYNKADSEGRAEMCLSDCDYAEQRIICAALVSYAKKLEAHAKGSSEESGAVPSDDAAIEHFRLLLLEYGMADDAILTKSARELKRKILEAVAPLLKKEFRAK